MAEFFRGWKRQVGVVTLLVACLLTAGWVRSTLLADIFDLSDHLLAVSVDGRVVSVFYAESEPTSDYPTWDTRPRSPLEREFEGDTRTWNFSGAGAVTRNDPSELVVYAPYPFGVAPLILFSLWLLLSLSRRAETPDLNEGN